MAGGCGVSHFALVSSPLLWRNCGKSGLENTWEMNLKKIVLETDSQVVCQLLTGNNKSTKSCWFQSLTNQIGTLLKKGLTDSDKTCLHEGKLVYILVCK